MYVFYDGVRHFLTSVAKVQPLVEDGVYAPQGALDDLTTVLYQMSTNSDEVM